MRGVLCRGSNAEYANKSMLRRLQKGDALAASPSKPHLATHTILPKGWAPFALSFVWTRRSTPH